MGADMSMAEWSFVILWPVVVVVFNNVLTARQLKHMANVTCENFNKAGQALAICLDAIRDIEEALRQQGVEIATPVDSRRAPDVWKIAS